jgi:hypothetical protein
MSVPQLAAPRPSNPSLPSTTEGNQCVIHDCGDYSRGEFSLNAGMGRFVGLPQTVTLRSEAAATIGSFLDNMQGQNTPGGQPRHVR